LRGLERLCCCLWRLAFGECRFGEAAGLLAAAGEGEGLAGAAEAGEINPIALIANNARPLRPLIFLTLPSTFGQRHVLSVKLTRANKGRQGPATISPSRDDYMLSSAQADEVKVPSIPRVRMEAALA
jgi:hypothetical protein